jgi:hypothetical protein
MPSGPIKPTVVALATLVVAACSGVTKDHDDGAVAAGKQPVAASQPVPADQPAAARQPAPADDGDPALRAAAQKARESFATGAPSVDALMDQFVDALSRKDKDALVKLRVNQTEYTDLIIPGTVPVGRPPRHVSQSPREFFWRMLDTKSRYFADNLVDRFGGRTYHNHELRFSKPTKEYAWYTAHGEVRMELQGDDDVTYHLFSGWVAEVDGRYKFIGYEYND